MLTVQNDWVEYEELAARRPTVRGGAACGRARASTPRPAAAVLGPQVLLPVTDRPTRSVLRPVAQPPRRRLRLTRRGRFVLVVLPALLAVSGSLLALSGQAPAEAATPAADARALVVAPGDSLWTIAERIAPDADPRAVVDALESANGLDAGQAVPAGLVLKPPSGR